MLKYLSRLSHYAFDAYLIVLFALGDICDGNNVINETKLVDELHQETLSMYNDNIISEMPSCLKGLFINALRRFDAMGVATIERFTTASGSSIAFVSCQFKNLPRIEELKLKINKLLRYDQQKL